MKVEDLTSRELIIRFGAICAKAGIERSGMVVSADYSGGELDLLRDEVMRRIEPFDLTGNAVARAAYFARVAEAEGPGLPRSPGKQHWDAAIDWVRSL